MRPEHLPTHPRVLHPGAWWLWAVGLAVAASRTANPVPLVLIVAVTWLCVSARRDDAPWAASYALFLKLGLLVIALHVVFQALLSSQTQGLTVLVRLPEVPLPDGIGIKLGGVVTLEALLAALWTGLQLATIFCCIGAANALGSSRRLLRYLPAALYEIGIAAVIALTFAPQLVTDVARVRQAARLRGRSRRGRLRRFGRLAMPVLEGALEGSVELAAAMDARGYGRTVHQTPRRRRLTSGLVLAGSLGLCLGVYGVLTAHGFGVPVLLAGGLLGVAGLRVGGRRTGRTRYRPDPWALPELLVVAAGVVPAATMWLTSVRRPELLTLASPTELPPIPLLACAGILVAALPAFLSPPPPDDPATEETSAPRREGGRRMIDLEAVSVTYSGAERPALSGVDLHVDEGELVLVMGATGSGKTTLLRTLNGLVPHFSGGTLSGRVVVDGRDTRTHRPRDLADVVGFVGQDPISGFVTDDVEDELAYGMESLGLPPATMRKRVEETLDLLGLADLRRRPLAHLSGGQQQRVAIGSVLTTHPRVLVLDEPTSALDPLAAEEVLATLQRLVHDLGLTVVLAEHRLERVVQHADRVVWLPGGGRRLVDGAPAEVLALTPIAPPVVELGRAAGWTPCR